MTQREVGMPSAEQRRVVEYWRLVELFNPQQVERWSPPTGEHRVTDVKPDRPGRVPWDFLAPPAARNGKQRVWRHTVLLGLYDISAVYEHLHNAFPRDEDAYDERPPGQSACAAVAVDAEGRLVPGTLVLSSAVWAVGRTIRPGVHARGWSDGFSEAQEALARELEESYLAPEVGVVSGVGDDASEPDGSEALPQRLDLQDLVDATNTVHAAAGITGLPNIATTAVRIISQVVMQSSVDDAPDQVDFLNSFLLDDLLTVSQEAWGPGLSRYLTPAEAVDVGARIDVAKEEQRDGVPDVQASTAALLGVVHPERLPAGRWPSNPAHHLATSQQFAVNEVAAVARGTSSAAEAVHGVNGPPGTGKTTLLRDVVAATVVRRAEALVALESPQAAFTETVHRWKSGDWPRSVAQLVPEVTGHEMVLASSNNGAVQNVSDELPQRAALHDPAGTADYFADLAAEIARRQGAGGAGGEGDDAELAQRWWGLVAARLGRSANRNDFISAFWFGRKASTARGVERPAVAGFLQMFKDWDSGAVARPSWSEARLRWREAHQFVDELVGERMAAHHRWEALDDLLVRTAAARVHLEELSEETARVDAERPGAEARVREVELDAALARDRLERHRSLAPGALSRLFQSKETTEWQRAHRELGADFDRHQDAEREARRRLDEVSRHAVDLHAQFGATSSALEADVRAVAVLEGQVRDDASRWGYAHPGGEWLTDSRLRQLHTPWLDEALDEARSALFLRSLDVHRAFLAGAPGVRTGLQASIDVVSGAVPSDLPAEARLAAWQLFFLAVPLVSTTFASVGRMFRGLRADSLGWLFVDEAGQATPQAAVGAVWRAQHLLAVGDPMQLTPVVTMPRRMQQDLAAAGRVADEWVPSVSSVQHVVDRLSRHGTHFGPGLHPLWVSQPLRVHRRCSSPMFEICNEIAYDGKMINGLAGRPDKWAELYPSSWFHVPAVTRGSHLQPAEVLRLRKALVYLRDAGVPMSEVIAISPFSDVRSALVDLAREHPGLTAGTVHTAQGKEADVVFFVLGGDAAKPGAKKWASSTPNLVNVAVSRARHRLYVIGDHEAWKGYPYFGTMARVLPVAAQPGA